jgi:bifunctional DNA-binding transcriptional regulator/antitoxin component of YhaV-PrlF toxin-antitoxin module
MDTTYQIQVGQRGVITLPKELRVQHDIADGDLLTLIELPGGVFVLRKPRPRVDEIANQLTHEWQKSDETLASMLTALREARATYDQNKSDPVP